MQSLIFAVGLVVKDALEKGREVWLVLQNMHKTYDLFFRLELLVAKIVKSLSLGHTIDFACFLYTWSGLDKTEASEFETLINNNVKTKVALQHLADVKKFGYIYGYRMEFRFFICTGKPDFRFSKVFFMAAGVFVNDTIWIGNSLAATQSILNIATGMINTLSSCGLFLGSSVTNMFCAGSGIAIADVLKLDVYMKVNTFHKWKKLDPKRPTLGWFVSFVEFIESGGLVGGSNSSCLPSSKFFLYNTGYVRDCLRRVGSDVIFIYTDSSVRDFGFSGASGGAAAYFPSVDIGVDVRVLGLLSFTLAKMQTITLALDCVPSYSSVVLFTDSQASLNLCAMTLRSIRPDFRKKCWMEYHTGVIGNECADFFTGTVTGSSFIFSVKTSYYFLSIEGRPLSGNTCHVVRRLYEAVNLVGWEFRYISRVVDESLSSLIDKHCTFTI
ncbi:hypothetical protein G9A89_022266 [Geosiphon pyriformis]|nr:hypothetical protein G9A89_022266 [Geosiphon pyriformis]